MSAFHVRIGLIGDPQYVDAENGTSFDRKVVRRYRQSLDTLQKASEFFVQEKTIFNVILGDIIDMKAKQLGMEDKCIDEVLDAIGSEQDYHFLIGNHDVFCLPRDMILTKYRFGEPSIRSRVLSHDKMYYSINYAGFRFVFLDTYDIGVTGASSEDHRQEAIKVITSNNSSVSIDNMTSGDWLKDTTYINDHYVPFNGSLGNDQFEWLQAELNSCDELHQKCIIISHIPCSKDCGPSCLAIFDYQKLCTMLEASSSVVACIAGHDHTGFFTTDSKGIHHLIPAAPLECSEGEVSYGHIDLFDDGLEITWVGRLPPDYCQWPSGRILYRSSLVTGGEVIPADVVTSPSTVSMMSSDYPFK